LEDRIPQVICCEILSSIKTEVFLQDQLIKLEVSDALLEPLVLFLKRHELRKLRPRDAEKLHAQCVVVLIADLRKTTCRGHISPTRTLQRYLSQKFSDNPNSNAAVRATKSPFFKIKIF
jgi:hypothetical protein